MRLSRIWRGQEAPGGRTGRAGVGRMPPLPADVLATAITAVNAVCVFPELTKVPHILEPSTPL